MREIEIGGAITILNAIATDIGATIGTNLVHKITITKSEKLIIDTGSEDIGNELVMSCLNVLRKSFSIKKFPYTIKIDMKYPPAKGMKTSSAVSIGVLYSISEELGLDISDQDLIQMSAEASINAGVSITGAIDDAYACWKGGYWVTDNKKQEAIYHINLDMANKLVLFLVPKESTPKSSIQLNMSKDDLDELSIAKNFAMDGDWKQALLLNTEVYGKYLLTTNAIDVLNEHVEGIVGLNGAGPSIFVITDADKLEDNEKIIRRYLADYTIINGKFR